MRGEITYIGEVLGVFTYIGERMAFAKFTKLSRPIPQGRHPYYAEDEWITGKLLFMGENWS